MIERDAIENIRDEAQTALDRPHPLSGDARRVRNMTNDRDRIIVDLCDELLRVNDRVGRARAAAEIAMRQI